MERIRKIIREELAKFVEIEGSSDRLSSPFENHPFFGDSEKMYNYAMEWAEKTNQLKHFRQLVGGILWNTDEPEQKVEQLKVLFKEYIEI